MVAATAIYAGESSAISRLRDGDFAPLWDDECNGDVSPTVDECNQGFIANRPVKPHVALRVKTEALRAERILVAAVGLEPTTYGL
jgi:hypothetical protein